MIPYWMIAKAALALLAAAGAPPVTPQLRTRRPAAGTPTRARASGPVFDRARYGAQCPGPGCREVGQRVDSWAGAHLCGTKTKRPKGKTRADGAGRGGGT